MLYAAYGSNLNLEQMAFRCPDSRVVGRAIVRDHRLVMKVHADIIAETGSEVPVLLWSVTPTDWKYLNVYEGYPKYYTKKVVKAEMEDGRVKEAVVYVMNRKDRLTSPPSMSYFNTCLYGCIENNMNPDPLYEALVESLTEAEDEREGRRKKVWKRIL